MKKAFTLVEIMIVIAVLSILMTITMKFGSNRISDLKYQNIKENFVSAYDQIYTQNMTSNYNNDARYENLNIQLKANENQIFYAFDSGDLQPTYIRGQLAITGIQADQNTGDIDLKLMPYTLGCEINNMTGGRIVSFDLLIENIKKYCFEINSNTCKLIEKSCNQ